MGKDKIRRFEENATFLSLIHIFNQHTYLRELKEGLFPENVYERVRRLKEEPRYRFEHMDKKRIDQYAEDFRTVYNLSLIHICIVNLAFGLGKLIVDGGLTLRFSPRYPKNALQDVYKRQVCMIPRVII